MLGIKVPDIKAGRTTKIWLAVFISGMVGILFGAVPLFVISIAATWYILQNAKKEANVKRF